MTDGPNGNGGSPATGSVPLPAGGPDESVVASKELHSLMESEEFRTLSTAILLDRYRFARQNGLTFGGDRDEYAILGYDTVVTSAQYRAEYLRGGIAGRIIDAMPDATWRGTVELVEDEDATKDTEFELAWRELDQRLQVQAKLCRLDKLSRLSTYAVLLIGATGGLETELPMSSNGSKGLLYLRPWAGGGGPGARPRQNVAMDADATIKEFDLNLNSPRFGLPLFYQIKGTDVASPELMKPVHHSRVLHVAEGLLDDDVYGQPALERVWNLLCDLRKVTGGGAEAHWLRANQGMHINVDKKLATPDLEVVLKKLEEQSEAYKHQLTRIFRTKGSDVKMLGSDVSDFGTNADAILTQIAGAKAMPKRILTGSEMGELASSQDRDNWKDQINGRQTSYAAPYIMRPLVDRLIKYGYLPTPTKGPDVYEVRWPHVQTLTEEEKAQGAKHWAETNAAMLGAGMNPAFTDAEIRDKWYGFGPLSPEEIDGAMAPVPEPPAPAVVTDQNGNVVPPNQLVAAEDAEILRVLEDAITSGNADVVRRILESKA